MSSVLGHRVFRKEAIDSTHLPEFHQIEGIIMEPGANLQMLVTTLKTFYAKMGYPEVRVRPAYFPYRAKPRSRSQVEGKWLELGGQASSVPKLRNLLVSHPPFALGEWGLNVSLSSFLA